MPEPPRRRRHWTRAEAGEKGVTLNRRMLRREQREEGHLKSVPPPPQHWRPRNLDECPPMPCPYAACRHHLAAEVNPVNGSIRLPFGEPSENLRTMPATCSLVVAREGEHTAHEVARLLNLSPARVVQIETVALARMGLP